MAVITMKTVAIRTADMLGMTRTGFVVFQAAPGAPSANLSQAGRQCTPMPAGIKRHVRVHKDANAAIDNPVAYQAGRPAALTGVARSWPSLNRWAESELRLPLFGRSARYRSSWTSACSASSAR
jgi:hypothetical protein